MITFNRGFKPIVYAVIGFLFFVICSNTHASIRARNGEIDLFAWNPVLDEAVSLKGQFKFFPDQFLVPEDLESIDTRESLTVKVPGSWNTYYSKKGEKAGNGYGTYLLTIKGLPENYEGFVIRIGMILSAYRIWINGIQKIVTGQPGEDKKKSQAAYNSSKEIYFYPLKGENTLLIQVSNFDHLHGGIWMPIELGTREQIQKKRDFKIIPELFLMGSFFMMGLYHLALFVYRKENKSALCLGMFCLLCTLRLYITGDTLLMLTFPEISWEIQQKIEYLTYVVATPFIILFVFYLYEGEMKPAFLKISWCASFIFSSIIIFSTTSIYSRLNIYYQWFVCLSGCYLIFIFLKAAFKKKEGAILECAGMILLITCVILDIFYYNEIISFGGGEMYALGLFGFIALQTLILSKVFSHAYNQMELLSQENQLMYKDIRDLNKNLEQKVDDRTQDLNLAVKSLEREIVQREKVEEKLRYYASTDALTGILNRSGGMHFLEKQFKLAQREKSCLSVIFIDVNGLKQINDTLGHALGDELISDTADIINRSLRGSDTTCRMGGDEFLIIFPAVDVHQAKINMQRILNQVERFNKMGTKPFRISLSYGLAQFPEPEINSVSKLVEKADNRMYRHKEQLKAMQVSENITCSN